MPGRRSAFRVALRSVAPEVLREAEGRYVLPHLAVDPVGPDKRRVRLVGKVKGEGAVDFFEGEEFEILADGFGPGDALAGV